MPEVIKRSAVLVFHGMGQQVPFETLGNVAEKVSQKKHWSLKLPLAPLEVRSEPLRTGKPNSDETISMVRMRVKAADTGSGSHEETVDFFESYWAPITEGKVGLIDALMFLLGAGWAGMKQALTGNFERFFWKEQRTYELPRLANLFSLGLTTLFIGALAGISICLLFLVGSHALQHLAELLLDSCQTLPCPESDWSLTQKLFTLDLFRTLQGELLFLLRHLLLLAALPSLGAFAYGWAKKSWSIITPAAVASLLCVYHLLAALVIASGNTNIPLHTLAAVSGFTPTQAVFALAVVAGQILLAIACALFSIKKASEVFTSIGFLFLMAGFAAVFAWAFDFPLKLIQHLPEGFLPEFFSGAWTSWAIWLLLCLLLAALLVAGWLGVRSMAATLRFLWLIPFSAFLGWTIFYTYRLFHSALGHEWSSWALWTVMACFLLTVFCAMVWTALAGSGFLDRIIWLHLLISASLTIVTGLAASYSFWRHWGRNSMHFWESSLANASLTGGMNAPDKFLLVIYGFGTLGVYLLIRKFLIQYAGDVAAYITAYKVSKFSAVRAQIQEQGFKTARHIYSSADYDKVILVGHSLGSVIAYDTLNGIINHDLVQGKAWQAAERTRLFLTFGSPLNKVAFIFRAQLRHNEIRERMAAAKQPLLEENHVYRPGCWVNVWSPNDVISGPLNYFDMGVTRPQKKGPDAYTFKYRRRPAPVGTFPGTDPLSGSRVADLVETHTADVRPVLPNRDPGANIPLLAHTQFWDNPLIYKIIVRALEDDGSGHFEKFIRVDPG